MDNMETLAEFSKQSRHAAHVQRARIESVPDNEPLTERNCLTLRRVHLQGSERWTSRNPGVLFTFAETGSGFWTACGVTRTIGARDLVVQGARQSGELQAAENSELAFSYFFVSVENLFPLFASQEIPCLLSVVARLNRPKVYPAADELTQSCYELLKLTPVPSGLPQRIQLLQVVAAILGPQLQGDIDSGSVRNSRADDPMVRLFEKLSVTELLTLSVSELSAKFNCSRRHLNRLFNDHFGLSVATLKMEMRLLKAASLLRHPETKIISVAEQCGFNHLGLFNTCFKKRFGASPGRWRKLDVSLCNRKETAGEHTPVCALRNNSLCTWTLHAERSCC